MRSVIHSCIFTICVLLPACVFAADTITLKPAIAPGMSWAFETSNDITSDNKASFNGQSQNFTTKGQSHRSGKVEVLACKNGAPTSIRVTFDDTCSATQEAMGNKQTVRYPFAGKTVTITRRDDGRIADDFRDEVDASSTAELHAMLDQEVVLFPSKPVAVGEEWKANPSILSRVFQLQGANDSAGMTLKLLSTRDVDGRSCAEVKVSFAVFKDQQGLMVKMISQGTALVDLQTGHVLKLDASGETSGDGQQSGPGPNGMPVTYQISGSGKSNLSESSKLLGTSPTAGPAVAPPAPSGDNPLATGRPGNLSGKYSDGKLTLDWAGDGQHYTGGLTLGGKKYPATAQLKNGKVEGAFTAGDNSFPFIVAPDGENLNLTTGSTTYKLQKDTPPAANPLDNPGGATPAPPNPLSPGSNAQPIDHPPGFDVVARSDFGKSMLGHSSATSVQSAIAGAFPDLAKCFDDRPKVTNAYEDARDHKSGGAVFTATANGKPVKGLISAKLVDNGANVAILYYRADAPADELKKLTSTSPQGANAIQPPPVHLAEYRFPDGTGSIGVADGWQTNSTSGASAVLLTGPGDQRVTIGFTLSVNTPDSIAVQTVRQLQANAAQMGMPAPPPPQMLVAPYCGPIDAIKILTPQVSDLSQRNGGPAIRLDKIISQQPAKSALPGGQAALVCYAWTKIERGQTTHYRALAQAETDMLIPGSWMFYSIDGTAPDATFDRDLPVMLAMAKSFKTNDAAVQQVTQRNVDNQNRNFAILQNAHNEQVASFDSYNKSMERNSNAALRSTADFDETIIGTRTIENTSTGERHDVDLGNVDQIVDKLNEYDPGRYRQIPLRDQTYPIDQPR